MTVMDVLIATGIATMFYILAGFAYDIIDYCIDQRKKKDCEKLDKHEDYIIRGHIDYNNNMNKQIVYKVDGDFNGNIKGDNVTVILMGDGNINGNIESKDGNIVLIKGNVNGDIKANKVVCPTNPTTDNKDQHICKSCYHYLQTPTGSYCTESSALGAALPVGCGVCKSYDGTGETTKYKSDCARPYKIKRDVGVHCKEEHDDTPPEEIIEYVYNRKLAVKYATCPIVHIKCPNCGKHFAKQLRVQTTILDGVIVGTNVEEMRHDY